MLYGGASGWIWPLKRLLVMPVAEAKGVRDNSDGDVSKYADEKLTTDDAKVNMTHEIHCCIYDHVRR